MTVNEYEVAMENAQTLGDVFDLMVKAQHDISLSDEDLDYLSDVEQRNYDRFY